MPRTIYTPYRGRGTELPALSRENSSDTFRSPPLEQWSGSEALLIPDLDYDYWNSGESADPPKTPFSPFLKTPSDRQSFFPRFESLVQNSDLTYELSEISMGPMTKNSVIVPDPLGDLIDFRDELEVAHWRQP